MTEEYSGAGRPTAAPRPARILFLYRARSGPLAALLDSARKLARSPRACALCSITHGLAGKKSPWRRLECSLGIPAVYRHLDELSPAVRRFLDAGGIALPVVLFECADGRYRLAVTAAALGECRGRPECLHARILQALGRFSLR